MSTRGGGTKATDGKDRGGIDEIEIGRGDSP